MDQYYHGYVHCLLDIHAQAPHAPCTFALAGYVAENPEVSSLWTMVALLPMPLSVAMGCIYSLEVK